MILNVLNQVWKAVERDFPVAPLHNELNNVATISTDGLSRSDTAILTEEEEPDIPAYLYTHKPKTYQALATKLYSQLNPSAGLIANLTTVVDVLDLKTNLNAPFRKWLDVLQAEMKRNPQNCLMDLLTEAMNELLAISMDEMENKDVEIPHPSEHIILDDGDTHNEANDNLDQSKINDSNNATDSESNNNSENKETEKVSTDDNDSIRGIDNNRDNDVDLRDAAEIVPEVANKDESGVDNVNTEDEKAVVDSPDALSAESVKQSIKADGAVASEEYEEKLSRFQKKVGRKMQFLITHLLPAFLETMVTFQTERKEELLYELIEKYITCKIYRKVQVADKISDYKFFERISTLQFVTTKNLDIPIAIDSTLIGTCGDLLTNMNFYKSPRCKLKSIALCCLHIFSYLESCYENDFVPVLTYIILKSNPQSLISNINYINDFRSEKLLLGSWGYFFTSIAMSIEYIEKLNPDLLTPSPEKLTEDWVLSPINSTGMRRLSRSLEDRPLPLNMSISPRGHHEAPRATPVEHTAADGGESARETHSHEEVQLVDVSSNNFLERYKYWNAGPSDITENDISELLAEYKRLAMFEYNTLKEKKRKG